MSKSFALLSSKAADAGKDVILVMHSYGGVPGSAAAKDLSKEERAKESKPGGIVRLVYLAAFPIEEGVSLDDLGGSLSSWCQVDEATVCAFSVFP
jgi:hypothetical protein